MIEFGQRHKTRIAADSRWATLDPYFERADDTPITKPPMSIEHAARIEESSPSEDPTARAYAVCHRLAAATLAAAQRKELS